MNALARHAPVAVALICFVTYVFAAVPTVYWLDSSELAAAAWTLGVAHPPGHPLFALWGRLFALAPLGGIGFRVALSQAAAGALAVAATCVLARELLGRLGAAPAAASLLGGAGGLVFGFSWGLAFQSVRPEVYALHAATALGAAALVVRADAARAPAGGAGPALAAAALLAGLSLANHHLLALAGLAPLGLFVLARRPRAGPATWALVLGALVLALGVYLYLPVRARAGPLVNWGNPQTAARWFWVVSARVFQKSVERASSGSVPFEIVRELGPLAALCALGGLAALVRARATRALGLLVGGEIAAYAAACALVGFDEHNPDAHGYLACALGYAAVAAVALPVALASALKPRWPRAAAAASALLGLALALSQPARGPARFSLARTYGAETTLASALAELPPRGAIDAGYFQTVFGLWYLRGVEGARPDSELYARHFARFPGAVAAASPAPARARPPLHEHDLDDPPALLSRLEPLGLWYRVGAGATPAALLAQDADWDRLLARVAVDLDDRETRGYLTWSFFLAAHLRCQIGARSEGLGAAERARALNRGDTPELAALRQRCQPP